MKTQIENDVDSLLKANKLNDKKVLKTVQKELYSRNTIGQMETIENKVMAKMFPINKMFSYNGGYSHGDEIVDFVIPVLIAQVYNGKIWVTDQEGEEFTVKSDELSTY